MSKPRSFDVAFILNPLKDTIQMLVNFDDFYQEVSIE